MSHAHTQIVVTQNKNISLINSKGKKCKKSTSSYRFPYTIINVNTFVRNGYMSFSALINLELENSIPAFTLPFGFSCCWKRRCRNVIRNSGLCKFLIKLCYEAAKRLQITCQRQTISFTAQLQSHNFNTTRPQENKLRQSALAINAGGKIHSSKVR